MQNVGGKLKPNNTHTFENKESAYKYQIVIQNKENCAGQLLKGIIMMMMIITWKEKTFYSSKKL